MEMRLVEKWTFVGPSRPMSTATASAINRLKKEGKECTEERGWVRKVRDGKGNGMDRGREWYSRDEGENEEINREYLKLLSVWQEERNEGYGKTCLDFLY